MQPGVALESELQPWDQRELRIRHRGTFGAVVREAGFVEIFRNGVTASTVLGTTWLTQAQFVSVVSLVAIAILWAVLLRRASSNPNLGYAVTNSQPPAATACSTWGSVEGCMLGGMALLWRWRARRRAAGRDEGRPKLGMGSNVQVCWDKFCRYW